MTSPVLSNPQAESVNLLDVRTPEAELVKHLGVRKPDARQVDVEYQILLPVHHPVRPNLLSEPTQDITQGAFRYTLHHALPLAVVVPQGEGLERWLREVHFARLATLESKLDTLFFECESEMRAVFVDPGSGGADDERIDDDAAANLCEAGSPPLLSRELGNARAVQELRRQGIR